MRLLFIVLWLATAHLLPKCFGVPVRRIARERASRPGSFFYHIEDGLHFHLNRQRNGYTYFKCVNYLKGCCGRAVYDPIEGFVHTSGHDHEPDNDYPQVMALRNRILDRCRNLEYVANQQIHEEESRRFRRNIRLRVTLENMRQPMARARAANYPNLPRTLRELTDILSNDRYRVLTMTRDGTQSLYAGSVTAADGSHHVLFTSRRMRQYLNGITTWFADGTFWATPRIPRTHQIFTIVTVWDNTIIPVAWVLMERRTEPAYTAVLELLRRRLTEDGDEPHVSQVVTDFEDAQQNAWRRIFPNANIQGCLWHASRAFIKYAVKHVHLLRWMRAVPHVHMIVRLCCALPLLPLNIMRQGFVLIVREARQQGDFLYNLLRPFLMYMFRNWIRHRRRRRVLCCYRSRYRTNNACESSNSRLNRIVGNAHPNIYSLLGALARLEHQAYDSVRSLTIGIQPNRRRKASSIRNDRRVRNLERGLRDYPGNRNDAILRFLHAASHLLDNVIDEIVQDDAEEPRRQ